MNQLITPCGGRSLHPKHESNFGICGIWFARLIKSLRSRGVLGAIAAGFHFAFPSKPKTFPFCADLISGRAGLEIGGPSVGFMPKGFFPLYPVISKLDNCNFSFNTVWEGSIAEGLNFQFDSTKPKGWQYVCEATDLKMIPDNTYDFILSSHALEHTANPIRALKEWVRVIKDNGSMILVLPHKQETLDHRRPLTTLQHMIDDFQKNTGEDDLTHLQEVLQLSDLVRAWGLSDYASFKNRSEKNFENRCVHHHVFNTELVIKMCDYIGLQILSAESIRPFHIIVAARKLAKGEIARNESFLSSAADWRKSSPFKIDRA
jgi:SAM-dependent methyltransferase